MTSIDGPIAARLPLASGGELTVSYTGGGVDLWYQHERSGADYTFPLDAVQCEVLETALRAARLAARKL